MLIQTLTLISVFLATFTSCTPCPQTEGVAGGGLPNSALPAEISRNGIKDIQLAQFLENLDISFFTVGSINISTWGTGGYPNSSMDGIKRIAAQDEVHLETLSTILSAYRAPLIPPCNYSFPVSSTQEFFEFADLLGSVGISATIGLSQRLADTDPSLTGLVSSILTVKSRYNAFIRDIQDIVPNPTPFDTGIGDIWAYNMALPFIVPGSCPVEIPIPILPRLTVAPVTVAPYTNSTNSTSSAVLQEFTWDPTQLPFSIEGNKQLLIGWVNQVDKPMYTPLTITGSGKGTASMPQRMNGIVFVAIAAEQYRNANDLALGTIAGPAVVVVS